MNTLITFRFSELAIGARFRYIPTLDCYEPTFCYQKVFVKISNDLLGACIAEWDDDQITSGWLAQGIYSLNDTGKDIIVDVVY